MCANAADQGSRRAVARRVPSFSIRRSPQTETENGCTAALESKATAGVRSHGKCNTAERLNVTRFAVRGTIPQRFSLCTAALQRSCRSASAFMPQRLSVHTAALQCSCRSASAFIPQRFSVHAAALQRSYRSASAFIPQRFSVRTAALQPSFANKKK